MELCKYISVSREHNTPKSELLNTELLLSKPDFCYQKSQNTMDVLPKCGLTAGQMVGLETSELLLSKPDFCKQKSQIEMDVSPKSGSTADEVAADFFSYVGKSVTKIDQNLPTRKRQHEQLEMPKSGSTVDQMANKKTNYVGKSEEKRDPILPTYNGIKLETRKSSTSLQNWLTPKHENTLYWCVFLLHYGETEYLAIGNKYKNAEVEEKMRVLNGLQSNLKSLKSACYKLTNDAAQQVLSSLMVNTRDDFATLIGYCVYYQLHIVLLFENKSYLTFSPQPMLELQWNAELPWYQIQCHRGARYNVYSVDVQPLTEEHIQEIRQTRVRLHNHTTAMRGVSSYRLPELETMAKRLNIPIVGKKEEVYAAIANVLGEPRA